MSISNSPCLLFDLPVEVVGEILGDWLELQSLVRVDSAVCNFSGRQILLKLFASKNCVQRRTVIMNTDSCARWFSKRKVRITQVALEVTSQEISKCLRLNSKSIWSVDCTESDAIDLVAMDCRNLTLFTCGNVVTKPNLNAALVYNMNLQELRLESVMELHVPYFDHVHLPHLKLVSLRKTSCDDALLTAIIHTTDELQHLNIGKCVNITDEGLVATAKHCPRLRSIALDELPITDAALGELTRLCPLIDNLRLTSHELITDSGVLCVAKNLKQLRTLDLSYCDITDLSLKYLTMHCRATLDTLYIIGMQQVRVNVLVHLLHQCEKLRSLCLDCDIGSYYDDVIPHMCNLQSLLLYSTLSDECLCSIARHCKQVRYLGIPSTFKVDCDFAAAASESAAEVAGGDVRVMCCAEEDATEDDAAYTEKGLLALVKGLLMLQRLWAPAVSADSDGNTLLHTMVQRMWQDLRPGLQFEQDETCFCYNILDGTAR